MDTSSANSAKSNRFDNTFRVILLLLVIHFLIQITFFHSIGRFIVDSGKELVTPWLLLDGQVLYRDIFWLYGPWAPTFNALLYQCFGVHADVLLWCSKCLGAGIIVTVYLCLRLLCPSRTAFIGALGVIGLTTTSNYFAWPYSFSNLWATLLALLAVYLIVLWQQRDQLCWLILSALSIAIVINCKFIIAFPVLITLWLSVFAQQRYTTPKPASPGKPWVSVILYTAFVLGIFGFSLWYYSRGVAAESYRLQIGAVFHARHLINAELYARLREAALLQNGLSAETISAAIAIWLCPISVLFGWGIWLMRWLTSSSHRGDLLIPLSFLLFASGNLLQMNSSVHAPYVFPACAVVLFWALGTMSPNAQKYSLASCTLTTVTTFCLLLGVGRLYKLSQYTGRVVTPRYDFRWEKQHADWLSALNDYVQKHTQATERIIIFGSRDYLYLICDRKPALGYLYTWYEPFHDEIAARKVTDTLKAGKVPLIITSPLEPFSLAFPENYRTHPIYQNLIAEYETVDLPDLQGQVLVWRKKSPTAKP